MRLFGVPEDVKHTMLAHPLDQPLEGERALAGTVGHLRVANDHVELLDSKDSALK